MKKLVLLLICLIFGVLNSYSQDFSKDALFGGVGVGFSGNTKADGYGLSYSMGYQRNIWKNRLRLVPNISFGTYTTKGISDVAATYYNSINFKVNLNFDILKIKSFALFIGSGLAANYSSGYTSGHWEPGLIGTSSGYFNESNFAFNAIIGLRLNPVKHRIGYELLFFDGSSDTKSNFYELSFLRVRIVLKLK